MAARKTRKAGTRQAYPGSPSPHDVTSWPSSRHSRSRSSTAAVNRSPVTRSSVWQVAQAKPGALNVASVKLSMRPSLAYGSLPRYPYLSGSDRPATGRDGQVEIDYDAPGLPADLRRCVSRLPLPQVRALD